MRERERVNNSPKFFDFRFTKITTIFLCAVFLFFGFNDCVFALTDVAPHNMTTDSAPSPYVTSAGSTYSGYNAFHAFDGAFDETHRWMTNGLASWMQLDMGSGNTYVINSYAIKGQPATRTAQSPTAWTMLGSNDGSTWDTLDTVSGEPAWSAGELRTYTCDVAATAYRYFRINITAPNAYVGVAELYLYLAPEAVAYTLVGPTGVVNGGTSTNFTIQPDGIFTGIITPNDGGDGGTFVPSSLTWSSSASAQTFTYTPASAGAKTISTSDNGSLVDPSSLSFYSATYYTIQPADLWDNGYSTDETDYYLSSPFARLITTTNATGLSLTVWSTLYSSWANNSKVAVIVDGTPTLFTPTANGLNTFTLDNLATGTKTIELVASTQIITAPHKGTFLKSVAWYGNSTTITTPSNYNRVTIYGDSTGVGWNTTNPPTDAVGFLIKSELGGVSFLHEAIASRSLAIDSN
ncbi:MAG: discoidin domain-containing protein, partial [Bacteroidota bacterium]